jgi:23S rRNA U2552 (ribose-2'-O)-methylase RlmE/FtsJ
MGLSSKGRQTCKKTVTVFGVTLVWEKNVWLTCHMCCCVLQGSGTQEFTKLMQQYFTKVVRLRVEASRSMSREFYAIGLGRKQPKKK